MLSQKTLLSAIDCLRTNVQQSYPNMDDALIESTAVSLQYN